MNTFLKILFGLMLLMGGCAPSTSPFEPPTAPPPDRLSVGMMQEDLRFIAMSVLEVHPAMLVEENRQAFEAQLEDRLAGLEGPQSRGDFYLVAAGLLASLGDAHTRVIYRSDLYLPLSFIWLSDGVGVSAVNDPSLGIGVGDEVVELGGSAPEEALESLRALIPAENDYWLKRMSADALSSASVLRALGLVSADGMVPVTTRTADGSLQENLLPFVSSRPEAPTRATFGWELHEEAGYALFWLDVCRDSEDYREEVRAFFTAVHEAGLTRIVIDLRRNGGGQSRVVDAFLTYLPPEEVRSGRVDVRYSLQAGYGAFSPIATGFYNLFSSGRRTTPRPEHSALIYTDEVYVLTSWHTFSAASDFAVLLSDNGMATIVGEATSGSPSSYGDILRFSTPSGSFVFSVSHKHFTRPAPERDPVTTLEPDVFIPTTIADFRRGIDPQLEWLRTVIDKAPRP